MHWDVVASIVSDPKKGAEIGVRNGNFTRHILNKFPNLTLYAVDLWEPRPPQDRPGYQTYAEWDFGAIYKDFKSKVQPFGERCIPIKMDSVAAADKVADGSLDFVFIDAEHTYEGVKRDIAAWRSKVKPGGILCGHDYGHPRFPGVKPAVDEQFDVKVRDTVWWVRIA